MPEDILRDVIDGSVTQLQWRPKILEIPEPWVSHKDSSSRVKLASSCKRKGECCGWQSPRGGAAGSSSEPRRS